MLCFSVFYLIWVLSLECCSQLGISATNKGFCDLFWIQLIHQYIYLISNYKVSFHISIRTLFTAEVFATGAWIALLRQRVIFRLLYERLLVIKIFWIFRLFIRGSITILTHRLEFHLISEIVETRWQSFKSWGLFQFFLSFISSFKAISFLRCDLGGL